MQTDDIVEEMRRYGDDYVARFEYDLKAIVADLQRRHCRTKNAATVLVPNTEKNEPFTSPADNA